MSCVGCVAASDLDQDYRVDEDNRRSQRIRKEGKVFVER